MTRALNAILTIEQDIDATEEEILEAWQYLLDSGTVWNLQGSYGRQAQRLIEAGLIHCTPPQGECPDHAYAT